MHAGEFSCLLLGAEFSVFLRTRVLVQNPMEMLTVFWLSVACARLAQSYGKGGESGWQEELITNNNQSHR